MAAGSCAFPGFGAVARAVQIISSLWEHVQRQLANDFIGGSLALATASFVHHTCLLFVDAWRAAPASGPPVKSGADN